MSAFRIVLLPLLFVVSPAQAELRPDPASVDFGKQRQEQVLAQTIRLTNVGNRTVRIIRVGADCSCTAASPDREALDPGQTMPLEIKFETRLYQGEITRRILVQTDQGDVIVPVKATVSPYDHWMLSAQMAVLPPSNKGAEASGSILLEYTGSGEAEVLQVETSVPWLQARVGHHSGRTTRLDLVKAAEAPAGNHQPRIRIQTNDPREPRLEVTAFVAVYSSVLVRPNPVILPAARVGEAASIPLSISGWAAREDPRFEIADGTATVQQRDAGEVLAGLSVTPDSVGTSTRLLRIFAGESLEAEIPVIVRGEP